MEKKFRTLQVCSELHDPETKQREILGLAEAMDRFSLKDGLIITENEDYDEMIEMKGKKYNVSIKPLWKWLRDNRFEDLGHKDYRTQ